MLDEWYLSLPLVSKFIEADLSDVDRTDTSRVFAIGTLVESEINSRNF